MRRFIQEICGVECGSRGKVVQNLMLFCAPNLESAPKMLEGICKSTPLLTYWPSLVEIP